MKLDTTIDLTTVPVSASTEATLYLHFGRKEWAGLRAATPLTLNEEELIQLRGVNEEVSLDEVAEIYLPLSRLLNLYVAATQNLHRASDAFLGTMATKVPYIIGMGGSVAVGKSTTARVLRALLARWPEHPKVEIVTTDGFLHPNRVLAERGLMERKGFPESYDVKRLMEFVADVKSGRPEVAAPVYSHLVYDIVPDKVKVVKRPDIVILEGLNVLQTADVSKRQSKVFVSDFFDFSIYVDAAAPHIESWYIERFLKLRDSVFRDEKSYFHRYADLSNDEARKLAHGIWEKINGPNLEDNIEPTRERATLILRKGPRHAVENVRLRRL